ncbi:TldD/PmbA family protein [bacterium]|nr:MAG: TldD/PmbA family protein [bacterium]
MSNLPQEKIIKAARAVIKAGKGFETEVSAHAYSARVLRFAGSVFHQGASHSDSDVYVRAISKRKVGVAMCNSLSAALLKHCFEKAAGIARHVKAEPFGLTLARPRAYADINSYFKATERISPRQAASVLSKGFKKAARLGVLLSGALITKSGALSVVNSNGVEAHHPYTSAHLSVVGTKDGASGISTAFSKDMSDIDISAVTGDSVRACLLARSPKDLRPGVYRALLWPQAVSELLYWLAYIGFGSKNFHEGTSFLSGRLGEKVTGDNVTIYDDGLNPCGMSVPFDMEGVPKKKTVLIENGTAKGVVYDNFTAGSFGVKTTGNASFPEDAEGPLPSHVFMEGGLASADEMVRALDTGIIVKSFHYVNGLLSPRNSLMTGMTRHGAFYVKNGRVKYPVNPLRFTDSILSAFSRIELASRETKLFQNHDFPLSSISAPAVLIDGFSFTG